MQLPKATTVTEKYLKAIYEELRKMNSNSGGKIKQGEEGSTKSNVKQNPPKEKKAAPPPPTEPVDIKGLERLECDICGKKFKTDASLKAHKTKMHK